MKELEILFRDKGLEFKAPKFYGEPLNLLKLWRVVIKLGGYDKAIVGEAGVSFSYRAGSEFEEIYVLVLNENGADVAKHCVPAVPSKRISITFRRMDENKRPNGYFLEPDLQGLQPLCFEAETTKNLSPHQHAVRQMNKIGFKPDQRRFEEPRYPSNNQHGPSRGFRTRENRGS